MAKATPWRSRLRRGREELGGVCPPGDPITDTFATDTPAGYHDPVNRFTSLRLLPWALLFWGCAADGPVARTAGNPCTAAEECLSNLCYEAVCLEPAADDDGDGLTNAVEADLGTKAQMADSDGDGASDYAEVADQLSSPPDEDGD